MKQRYLSLDFLRGLTIFGMVFSAIIPYGVLPAWMYHIQNPPPSHELDIAVTGGAHFRPCCFRLFSGAGHNGNADDFGRVDACFFGKVGFGNRAEHLLRRFSAGKMVKQFRVFQLNHVYPARAARGNHRQHAAVLQTVDKFVAFFHNGKVGGKIGIKNFIKAKMAQGCNHFAGYNAARLHAKLLADSDAHGRRGLYDNNLVRVVDGIPDFFGVVAFHNRAGRANAGTLAAEAARYLAEVQFKRGGNNGIKAAVGKAVNIHALYIAANADAAAAEDAFFLVAYKARVAAVNGMGFARAAFKADFTQAEVGGNFLQFAVAAFLAGQAVFRMVGKQKLPSATGYTQEATRLLAPLASTTHRRQAPSGASSGW